MKTKEIRVRVSEDLHQSLNGIAERRGENVSDLVRRHLGEIVIKDAAEDSLDLISIEIRKALQDILKPHINRLAALNAKTAITSGTAMYLNLETLNDLGKKDVVKTYERARQKAVAYLKTRESEDD